MKSKIIFSLSLVISAFFTCLADINVTFPSGSNLNNLNFYYAPIKQMSEAKTRAERGIEVDSVAVVDSKALIKIPSRTEGYYFVLQPDDKSITLFALPGENINVDIKSFDPFSYTMSGTDLVDGMTKLNELNEPINLKVRSLYSTGEPTEEEIEKIDAEYSEIQKNFIDSNPESPAIIVALMNLEGQPYIEEYETLLPMIEGNFVYPMAKRQYESEKKNIEMQKRQEALQNGSVDAPDFTLKDLEGKDVSLSDFRGKWVIIDFWGSWCPWCIKGFPELKEAYSKYAGKLEIIGVDCNESEADWKAGVEKYELPWVNVYNPKNSEVLANYGVQGFPTKAIIDPEGKIRNITVGHNPAFFTILTDLIGK